MLMFKLHSMTPGQRASGALVLCAGALLCVTMTFINSIASDLVEIKRGVTTVCHDTGIQPQAALPTALTAPADDMLAHGKPRRAAESENAVHTTATRSATEGLVAFAGLSPEQEERMRYCLTVGAAFVEQEMVPPDDIADRREDCAWPNHTYFGKPWEDSLSVSLKSVACNALLRLVDEELYVKRRIHYHVRDGTLLGAYRDGGIIVGDDDLDMTIFVPSEPVYCRRPPFNVPIWRAQAQMGHIFQEISEQHSMSPFHFRFAFDSYIENHAGINLQAYNLSNSNTWTMCRSDVTFVDGFKEKIPIETMCNCKFNGHELRRCTKDPITRTAIESFYGETWWLRLPLFKGFRGGRPSLGLKLRTEEQIQNLLRPFRSVDANGDDLLSREEFLELLRKQNAPSDGLALITGPLLDGRIREANWFYECARNYTLYGTEWAPTSRPSAWGIPKL
eukprot:Opistho-2@8252